MKKWCEIQICYSQAFKERADWSILYRLKRECLLSILDKYSIEDFLILDETDFVLFRVEVDENTLKEIVEGIKVFIDKGSSFSTVNVADWSPEKDARARILGAKQRGLGMGVSFPEGVQEGGWKVLGRGQINGEWNAGSDEMERKVEEFSRFMTKVAGQFTKAYIKEIPNGVDDPWMMSVFVHLLLDSVSVWQNLEEMTRDFPFI